MRCCRAGRLPRGLKAVLWIAVSCFFYTLLLHWKVNEVGNTGEELRSRQSSGSSEAQNLPASINEDQGLSGGKIHEPKTTKVIFLTYSRSGTSFVGELINRNKNGFYYFEPLFGIYSYLYGLPFGVHSGNFFTLKNGGERHSSDYEAMLVSQQLNDLVSCNLENLPSDFLQTPFNWKLGKGEKLKTYANCLKHVNSAGGVKANKKINQSTTLKVNKKNPSWLAYNCKMKLGKKCSKLDGKSEYSCFKELFGKKFKKSINVPKQPETVKKFMLPKSEVYPQFKKSAKTAPNFQAYMQCMKSSQAYSDQCSSALQKQCRNSTVVGAKIIRWRMENVAYLLRIDPTIKVVHYLRDPRGTLLSRSEHKKDRNALIMSSAKTFCDQIKKDIIYRKQLEKIFPDNFYTMKYEDLASYPVNESEKLYHFLNTPMPQGVKNWVYSNTHSQAKGNMKELGTSRKNSTATAHAWEKKIPRHVISDVAKKCKDTLELMGYS